MFSGLLAVPVTVFHGLFLVSPVNHEGHTLTEGQHLFFLHLGQVGNQLPKRVQDLLFFLRHGFTPFHGPRCRGQFHGFQGALKLLFHFYGVIIHGKEMFVNPFFNVFEIFY